MPNFNRVFLIGNLTADPETKPATSKKTPTTFRIATNHTFTAKDGTKNEQVCFVDIVTWGTLGLSCQRSLKKGKLVFVEGRLEYNTWEKDGTTHAKHQVQATTVLFLSPLESNNADPIEEPSAKTEPSDPS